MVGEREYNFGPSGHDVWVLYFTLLHPQHVLINTTEFVHLPKDVRSDLQRVEISPGLRSWHRAEA